jgi:hypothetical protein
LVAVLAVDPGKVTGYVLYEDGKRIEGELPFEDFLAYVAEIITTTSLDAVVCERYIISAQTGKLSQAPWSLETIGVLRFLCNWKSSTSFVLQNVGDAKRFATDERLNHIGWKRPSGAGHARDAQRHLLLYLVNNSLIDKKVFMASTINML